MADKTSIEWTDASWTPIRARCWEIQNDGSGKERIGWHCEHVSEGCRNCYAERINQRLGTGFDFKPGNLRGRPGYYGDSNDRPELFLDEKMLLAPLRWKKPRMIFVCSMTDAFADFVKDEWLDKIFAIMALCPQHTFQVLTKRAERMREYLQSRENNTPWIRAALDFYKTGALKKESTIQIKFPLPNVWLGVSCERQHEFNERWPLLRDTPSAIRFISYEPALGRLDACEALGVWLRQHADQSLTWERAKIDQPRPDWFICGGESGSKARPMHPDWARSLRDQCAAAGVAFFFKQWGEYHPAAAHDPERCKQQTPDAICIDGRREFMPSEQFRLIGGRVPGWAGMCRLGKKAAGRLLDGREHSEFPKTESTSVTDGQVQQRGLLAHDGNKGAA